MVDREINCSLARPTIGPGALIDKNPRPLLGAAVEAALLPQIIKSINDTVATTLSTPYFDRQSESERNKMTLLSRRIPSMTLLASRRALLAGSRRSFASSNSRHTADQNHNPFATGPAPPRLPKEEQEIFEELQRKSTGAFSTPRTTPRINQSPDSQPEQAAQKAASSDQDELHPDIREGVKPEFEGEKNPKTGEVGGPKNEPLRWGHQGDWSYNGRVTDF